MVTCPYCKASAVLKDSAEVYDGRSYGLIWDCRPCDAYVGVHKNSREHKPLGRLANKELRKWKIKAHAAFDHLWKTGRMKRREAYAHMQIIMGMTPKQAHIGNFDVDDCKRLVILLTEDARG